MVGPYNQYSSSMFWPPMQQQQYHNSCSYHDDDDYSSHNYIYSSSSSSSSSSSVDCTLSLGTPSTRLTPEFDNTTTTTTTNNYDADHQPKQNHRNNSVSSFCWDLLHPTPAKQPSPKPHRSSNSSDPLLARRCANCDTTSTPLWRNGPRGPKSLCNACGIRFKKEERRAAAATNTAAAAAQNGAGMMDPNNQYGYYNNGSWAQQYGQATPQKMQCFGAPNEFRFMEDDRGSDGTGIQFVSWLTHDRPSGLVHDFTR